MSLRFIVRGATFSPCERYRFTLDRTWDARRPLAVFIGVNPSTATAELEDPTIRRCIAFAKAAGCGRFRMLNLFAWRATDVNELLGNPAHTPENDAAILAGVAGARFVVCAWGAKSGLVGRLVRERADAVLELLKGRELYCLSVTNDGSPAHPLYLPKTLKPIPYGAADVGGLAQAALRRKP